MADSGTESGQHEASVVDITTLTLDTLASSDSSVLANSIRSVIAELGQSAETISGWSSYIDVANDRIELE